MSVLRAESDDDFEEVRKLFREYAGSLEVDLRLQGLEDELTSLPGKYAPPGGVLLLARRAVGEAIGCVGVRPLDRPGACELKRLYVRPAGRGTGAGRALATAALAFAQEAAYREILLDSLPSMTAAIPLYRSLGFTTVPPYWESAFPGTLYFGRRLRD